MAKRIDNLTADTEVTLRFHGRGGTSTTEKVVFLGVTGSGDDRRATFRSTQEGRVYTWDAYRYNGRWAYGTSADRLSLA